MWPLLILAALGYGGYEYWKKHGKPSGNKTITGQQYNDTKAQIQAAVAADIQAGAKVSVTPNADILTQQYLRGNATELQGSAAFLMQNGYSKTGAMFAARYAQVMPKTPEMASVKGPRRAHG